MTCTENTYKSNIKQIIIAEGDIGGSRLRANFGGGGFVQQQAGPDITGQLQVRPMLYTLYFDINLRVVKMLQTDNKQQITK